MKNILIIQESMTLGGSEKVLSILLNYIDYTKYSVTLLLIFEEGEFLKDIPNEVEIIGLYGSYKSILYRIVEKNYFFKNLIFEKLARKKLFNRHFDTTVSFMEGPAASLHYSLLDIADNNVSWIHTDIDKYYWYKRYFKRKDEKRFYNNLNRIVFVSDCIKKLFTGLYDDIETEKITIYNPVDIGKIEEQAQKSNIKKSRFTICCVGRLVEPKRLDRVIDMISVLKNRNIEIDCWLIGSGDMEQWLRARATEKGVERSISFLGYQDNPYQYIQAADLLLHTADYEGFAMVIPESLAVGTPVVATPFDVAYEVLAYGGGVISSFDTETLAKDVEMLIKDHKTYSRLVSECRPAASMFVLKETLNKFESVL